MGQLSSAPGHTAGPQVADLSLVLTVCSAVLCCMQLGPCPQDNSVSTRLLLPVLGGEWVSLIHFTSCFQEGGCFYLIASCVPAA